MKLVVPLKLSTVWFNVTIAPPPNAEPPNGQCLNVALLSRKVVFPVNVRLLLEAMIAPPSLMIPQALLCVNSVLPDRVMSVLFTTSVVPLLPWKEQLTSSVCW